MTSRETLEHDKTLSRRTLVQALAAGAGAMVAGPVAGAGAIRARGAAEHRHHAAARFRPKRRADHLFLRPRHHRGRPELQRSRAAECGDQAAVDRRAVGRRAGVERAGALSGVERHSEQSADAMDRRTTAASACSASPSNNSNGNTFDFQGRQLSCEHLTRRVVRYEHDGSVDGDRRQLSTASG